MQGGKETASERERRGQNEERERERAAKREKRVCALPLYTDEISLVCMPPIYAREERPFAPSH